VDEACPKGTVKWGDLILAGDGQALFADLLWYADAAVWDALFN
jgi:hypothetical protein